MLCAGDEFARTQGGNNNAYCQDNEISWVDWALREENADLLEFTRRWLEYRKKHPCLRRTRFFEGRDFGLDELKDITWLRPDGVEMAAGDWSEDFIRCLGFVIDGKDLREVDEHGRVLTDGVFLILLNAHHAAIPFKTPTLDSGHWRCLMDTAEGWLSEQRLVEPGDEYSLEGRSVVLLEWSRK